jgi:hypothetical protein
MGSKSQRQKERHARKRQEKRKKQEQSQGRQIEVQRNTGIALGSNARHRQRLSQQLPRAWPGETPEDVAVFDDSALATLPPELAQQVSVVREALENATQSRGEEAIKSISVIPRGSPLSEWRLFIRGLVDWLADNTEAASEAWKRLDSERRPGRIATAMMIALRSDLEQASHLTEKAEPVNEEPTNASPPSPWSQWDDQLLYQGKLLRRVRFDRAALRVAEAGVNVPEEVEEFLLGPKKLHWLKQFVKEYGDTEPDLVAAMSQAALNRAFNQQFADVFEETIQSFSGPRHDPRNLWLAFLYYGRFTDDSTADKRAERALEQYLNRDLPQNDALTEALRGAIASQIHFCEAMELIEPDRGEIMPNFFYSPPEDSKAIRKHLSASLKADPRNLLASKAYLEWLEFKLNDERMTQPKRKPLEQELAEVMRNWSQARPEDVEPRLWLVDHLLENEQLEEARPHVDYLAASRMDDPRVRATPWKWQLLEAMRLCRRKVWLAEAPARLDEAEALWPTWLSKEWLPYLRAAWTLRNGQAEAFESQRDQICQNSGLARDSLSDACMMLGAAQQMRVPAEDLKPLRVPLDQALKKIKSISLEDLIKVGGFFWDLHRTQLVYPAYRMHGATIGKELVRRLAASTKRVVDGINDGAIHAAVLWGSEFRFWSSNYQTRKMPFFSNPTIQRHPMFAAAKLNAFLKESYRWGIETYQELGFLLREVAPSQVDPYYRHWFLTLSNRLEDAQAKESSRFSGFSFGNNFGRGDSDDRDRDDDDNEDDFDDDGLDFDPDCNCPQCRKARLAYEEAESSADQSDFENKESH